MYKAIVKAHIWNFKSKNKLPVYWNIRNSNFRFFQVFQRLSLYAFGILSHILKPNIVYVSLQAKKVHESYFFSAKNQQVITNRWAKVIESFPQIKQPEWPFISVCWSL